MAPLTPSIPMRAKVRGWTRPLRAGVRKSLVFGTGSGLYGNHIFSVYPSDLDPPSSKFGLNHPQTAGIRKRVPFRITGAGPAAIRSAFLIEADQTLTATACLQMTQSGQ